MTCGKCVAAAKDAVKKNGGLYIPAQEFHRVFTTVVHENTLRIHPKYIVGGKWIKALDGTSALVYDVFDGIKVYKHTRVNEEGCVEIDLYRDITKEDMRGLFEDLSRMRAEGTLEIWKLHNGDDSRRYVLDENGVKEFIGEPLGIKWYPIGDEEDI